MRIKTTRFGEIEVIENSIINFPYGLIGNENLKQFYIFNKEEGTYFWWLQSIEKPETAFLLAEPQTIVSDYNPEITQEEMEAVGATNKNEIELNVILTIPEDPRETTVNLLAPILLNTTKKLAKQIVVKDNRYSVNYPISQPATAGI